jgi:DNA-binding response OmpR family regulator
VANAPNPTVVVIDDNTDIADSLAMLLALDGFEVVTAYDGLNGLEAILREQPFAAVVDIGLPGISGYEVATKAKGALGATVRLIAVTGWGQHADKATAFRAGFDNHLTKPAAPEDIVALVKAYAADLRVDRVRTRENARK